MKSKWLHQSQVVDTRNLEYSQRLLENTGKPRELVSRWLTQELPDTHFTPIQRSGEQNEEWTGVEIQLYAFINVAPDAGERQLHFPTASAPRKQLPIPIKEDAGHSTEENLSPPPAVSLVLLLAELSKSLCSICMRENIVIFKAASLSSGRNN